MNQDISSPERSPAKVVRVTYAGKQKRRESDAGSAQEGLASGVTVSVASSRDTDKTTRKQTVGRIDVTPSPILSTPSKPITKNESPSKKSTSRNAHAPHPPSPAISNSTENANMFKSPQSLTKMTIKVPPSRVSSNNSTVTGSPTASKSVRSSSMKPPSVAGSKMQPERVMSPDDGSGDDTASVAGSSKGFTPRNRKSEFDRIQFFKDDATCGDIEPHRAFCKGCNKWVDLQPKRKYVMKPWVVHRKWCKAGLEPPSSTAQVSDGEGGDDDGASIAPSMNDGISENPRSRVGSVRRTESERLAVLQADERIGEIHPDVVYCKPCVRWIRLSTQTKYALANWQAHASRCLGSSAGTSTSQALESTPMLTEEEIPTNMASTSPPPAAAAPTSRVDTPAEELIHEARLAKDPQVQGWTALFKCVTCRICGKEITSDSSQDYDLTKWEEHKLICPPVASGAGATPSDTDTTVVGSEGSPSRKRAREDDEHSQLAAGGVRIVRARTENYKPPQGMWKWLTEPIRNFVAGFRQGLASAPSNTEGDAMI